MQHKRYAPGSRKSASNEIPINEADHGRHRRKNAYARAKEDTVTGHVPTAPTFEGRPLTNPAEPVFDQGLAFDLQTLVGRRQLLKLIGTMGVGASVAALAACLPSSSSTAGASFSAGAGSSLAAVASADCATIPEETAGPFPGDGSNGPDVLTESGVVRRDITTSFGSSSAVAEGIPLTIRLLLQDQANGCTPLVGAAAYLWHCDREGRYSLYSPGVTGENYLRGVQESDADGVVTFDSIYPGCYAGRWPHIHFEVYRSLGEATNPANKIATSQIALPKDTDDAVFATLGYEQSVQNFAQMSLRTDMVFGDDGGAHQLGTISGSVAAGYTVQLAVPVSTT
jgi:protocatechuate 3,4-dioxygenase beta subunit